MVPKSKPQVKRSIHKTYTLDKRGNAHIKRKWILQNLTDGTLALPLFFVEEETDQILNIKSEVKHEKVSKGAFTEITLEPKEKLGPREKYEFSIDYDYNNFSEKFGDTWIVTADFVKEEDKEIKFHDHDEYMVETRLPNLKRRWALWESFEVISDPTAEERKEEGATILSWQFVLRPEMKHHIKILYQIMKNQKIFAGVVSIITIVVREVLARIVDIIFKMLLT